jgi:dolichyl-phosphate-mannose--protein O-mannosyl transferase
MVVVAFTCFLFLVVCVKIYGSVSRTVMIDGVMLCFEFQTLFLKTQLQHLQPLKFSRTKCGDKSDENRKPK